MALDLLQLPTAKKRRTTRAAWLTSVLLFSLEPGGVRVRANVMSEESPQRRFQRPDLQSQATATTQTPEAERTVVLGSRETQRLPRPIEGMSSSVLFTVPQIHQLLFHILFT